MSKRYDCFVVQMNPGVTVPALRFGGNPIESYFESGSQQKITIRFDRTHATSAFQNSADVVADDLHFALTDILQNQSRPVSRIGLLFASQLRGRPGLLGVMFDLGFKGGASDFDAIPREGCAVFTKAVERLRPGAQFNEELMFTAAHELAHVFNLGHIRDPLCLTSPSRKSGIHLNVRDFAPTQNKLLELADHAEEIQPGGKVYGAIAPLTGGGEYGVTNVAEDGPFGLELHVEMTQREFWPFEPVELEIEVRVIPGLQRTFFIPDTLDPGFEAFDLWIEDPDGERRRYRPTKRMCAITSELEITAGTPFRRDISIFGQSGGYTFRMVGVHRLHVVLKLPDGGALHSNTIEVNVLPRQESDLYATMRDVLTAPGVPEVLFYRTRRARNTALSRLEHFAETHDWTTAASGVRYAVARSLLNKREHQRDRSAQHKMTTRAVAHLKNVADDEKTSPHRRELAEAFLSAK